MHDEVREFIRRHGPERERQMGFRQEALEVFEPLLSPYGYRCVDANPFIVTFESERDTVMLRRS